MSVKSAASTANSTWSIMAGAVSRKSQSHSPASLRTRGRRLDLLADQPRVVRLAAHEPPEGERALRLPIQQRHTVALLGGLDGERCGDRSLARASLCRGNGDRDGQCASWCQRLSSFCEKASFSMVLGASRFLRESSEKATFMFRLQIETPHDFRGICVSCVRRLRGAPCAPLLPACVWVVEVTGRALAQRSSSTIHCALCTKARRPGGVGCTDERRRRAGAGAQPGGARALRWLGRPVIGGGFYVPLEFRKNKSAERDRVITY